LRESRGQSKRTHTLVILSVYLRAFTPCFIKLHGVKLHKAQTKYTHVSLVSLPVASTWGWC